MNPFIEAQKTMGAQMQANPQTNPQRTVTTNQNLMANPMNLINEVNRFARSFSGDPKAMVDQMLNSGQITTEQYNQAVQMANSVKGFFGM